jgi:predicted nucleic acid-binding protein
LEIYQNQDFEDALQVATALENNCTKIITLDKQIAKKYQVLVDLK